MVFRYSEPMLSPSHRTTPDAVVERLGSADRSNRIFIDGEWVLPHGSVRAVVTDPSIEDAVAQIALGDANDVALAVAAARRAFTTWSVNGADRAAILDRIHALILSGQVHINHPAWSPHAPVCGYKRSGNGLEYGTKAWRSTSKPRPFSAFTEHSARNAQEQST